MYAKKLQLITVMTILGTGENALSVPGNCHCWTEVNSSFSGFGQKHSCNQIKHKSPICISCFDGKNTEYICAVQGATGLVQATHTVIKDPKTRQPLNLTQTECLTACEDTRATGSTSPIFYWREETPDAKPAP